MTIKKRKQIKHYFRELLNRNRKLLFKLEEESETKIREFKIDERTVSFEESDVLKEQVYSKVLNWFIENKAFHGEVIAQSDHCLIESPYLLCDLSDNLFKFKVEYNE